jgi:hypothetical protein
MVFVLVCWRKVVSCVGMKVTGHYVENVCESSTREKQISNLPKIRWKIQYLFCNCSFRTGRTWCMKVQRYLIAFLRRTFVERKRFPIFPRFLDPFWKVVSCVGMKVTDHYVENVCESSTREKRYRIFQRSAGRLNIFFVVVPSERVERGV